MSYKVITLSRSHYIIMLLTQFNSIKQHSFILRVDAPIMADVDHAAEHSIHPTWPACHDHSSARSTGQTDIKLYQ